MQLIAFPSLGSAPHETWAGAAMALAAIAQDGEDAVACRARLLGVKHIDAPAVPMWFAMFGVAVGAGRARLDAPVRDALTPQPGARLAQRLWQVNPLLAATVHRLLAERPHSRDEIYKFLGSAAYQGELPSHPELANWLAWAALVGVVRPLGVALAAGPGATGWDGLAKAFDADAFVAEHAGATVEAAPAPAPDHADGAVRALSVDANTAAVARTYAASSPGAAAADAHREVPPAVLRIDETVPLTPAARLEALADLPATAQAAVPALVARVTPTVQLLTAQDAQLDPSLWQEDSSRALLQLGLLAALAFRPAPSGHYRDRTASLALYRTMLEAKLLDALIEGQLPAGVPASVDASSLLLASVLARRLAEAPMLPDQLASAGSLHAAMVALDVVMGRGLLGLELFWVARALAQLGVLRYPGLGAGPAIPWREARNALARWGVLPTPYAADMEALIKASSELSKFATASLPGDAVVLAWQAHGGCAAWTQSAQAHAQGCLGRSACLPFCLEHSDLA
ncbi:MAG: hypothetical protein IPL79_05865 [Myxococcales bacterium]|nr:hypothetical protein [Myxococcales bacterium]